MSTHSPPRPAAVEGSRRFAIVASTFNAQFVDGLVEHARRELQAVAPNAPVELHRVPGAFEIPVVVRELAVTHSFAAVVAMGVIIQGETPHAEHLARSVTDALQQIAIEHGVPVINAVLSLNDETQAQERCLGDKINRGTEAARAAVEVAGVMAQLRKG